MSRTQLIIRQSYTGEDRWFVEQANGLRVAMFRCLKDAELFVKAKEKQKVKVKP